MRRTKLPSVSSTIFQADAFILPFLCLLASFPLFCSPSHHVHTCTQMSLRSWELRFNFCNLSWSRFTSGTCWAPYWAQGWCVNQETASVIAPYPHLSLGATSFPIRKRCLSCRCRAGRDACTVSLNGGVTSGIFVNLEYWSSLVHWMWKHGGKKLRSCLLRIRSELWRRGASVMVQQGKALITKPDNLSFLPRTHPHGGRRESTPEKLVFCSHGHCGRCLHTCVMHR